MISYLESCSFEIGNGNIKQVILDHVDKTWYGDLQAIHRLFDDIGM